MTQSGLLVFPSSRFSLLTMLFSERKTALKNIYCSISSEQRSFQRDLQDGSPCLLPTEATRLWCGLARRDSGFQTASA